MKVFCDFTFALIKVFLGFKNLALNILVALNMTNERYYLWSLNKTLLNEANDSSILTFSLPPRILQSSQNNFLIHI